MAIADRIARSPRYKDLTGLKFGRLTVIEQVARGYDGFRMWRCVCVCGIERVIRGCHLTSGKNKSCGCLVKQNGRHNFKDLTGSKIGHWTVLEHIPGGDNGRWLCRCDCGIERPVFSTSLHSGESRSCGCGFGKFKKSKTVEYKVWWSMLGRCHSKTHQAFHNYGARGIKVCNRWRKSFETFLEDMGPRKSTELSIERIKNDLGYKPGNCKWATRVEQSRNKRTSFWITVNGQTRCSTEWAELTGIPATTIRRRIKDRWKPELAISIPVTPAGRRAHMDYSPYLLE